MPRIPQLNPDVAPTPNDSVVVYDADTDSTKRVTLVQASQAGLSGGAAYVPGGTDVPIADGGTGASTAADARTNLGVYSTAQVDAAVAALVDAAPGTLNTLNELAAALGDDANFASTITALIALKATDTAVVHNTGNETVAGTKTFTSDPIIPDEAYGVGWNGSLEPPTKNATYDKIETVISGAATPIDAIAYAIALG